MEFGHEPRLCGGRGLVADGMEFGHEPRLCGGRGLVADGVEFGHEPRLCGGRGLVAGGVEFGNKATISFCHLHSNQDSQLVLFLHVGEGSSDC